MKIMREAFVRVWRDTGFPRRHQSRVRDRLRLLQHEQLEQRCVLTLPATQTFAEGDAIVYNGPTVDLVSDTFSFDAFVDFGGDVDSYFFAPQFNGTYTIDVGDFGNTVDPEVAVYIASTGARIGYNDDVTASNDDARLSITLTSDVRYIIAVADQPATTAGNVSIVVSAPSKTGSFLLTPDASGDATTSVLLDVPTDIDYYSVTAPANANGGLTVSAAGATFNQRLALFNSAGTLLQGPLISINYSSAVPGQEYRIAVFSSNYATAGTSNLLVNFNNDLPDIRMTSVISNGNTGIALTYEITNGSVAPFSIDIFQSNNALMDGVDTQIGTLPLGPGDRTVGVHTVNLTLGSGITLPGAGIADPNIDYRLLFTADSANLVGEPDVDPRNEDNTVVFAGVYHQPAGPVMAFGTDSADTVTVTPSGVNVGVNFNNLITVSYPTSDVTQFRVRGAGGDDHFTSGAANATMSIPLAVWGGAGLDTMVGGDGNDTLSGGADDDIYVFLPSEVVESDTIEEAPGGGRDKVDFSQLSTAVTLNLGLTTPQGVNLGRLLTLTSSSGLEDATGGSAADLLIGNSNANQLFGFGGGDSLLGGQGDDVYIFGTAASSEADQVTENVNEGNDTLNFASVATSVVLNMAANSVQPAHANRTLKLNSPITFENAIGGSGADNLIGNSLNNTLRGGPGDDTLNGALGSDLLFGGANNDTYLFGAASVAEADEVSENVNEGTDTLNYAFLTTSVVLNMAANSVQPAHANRTLKLNSPITFENAIGGSGADNLIGNSLNNTLRGGPGDDTLNGALGSDLLFGGANNDTYLFGAASVAEADEVSENVNEGTDTLNYAFLTTSVVLNMGANSVQPVHVNRTLKLNSPITFENAIGGSGADNLIGNSLSNTLTGGPGDDTLNGAGGSDLLIGGANNDTYLFGAAAAVEADQVTENANDGIDLLNFAFLTTDVVLNLGSTAIQPVHLNRTLKLNSVSTFENAMGGTGNDTLLGNVLANRLTGGNGNNILIGLEGADILVSGSGRDILIGGLGLDVLNGGAGDDILIAGGTTSDTILTSLTALRTAWVSADSYATRITNLRAGVGNPLVSLKTTINVLNDGGEDDVMVGGTDTDWFFRALDDVITDLVAGEILDLL